MRRALSAAYWTVPSLFCLILYWYGLKSWFRADDFAWLGLGLEINKPSDFWHVMFAPMAQGTIRPLSERVYFIGLHALFGLDALPFRICAFATQFANLVLLSWIVLRVTDSRIAGFFAPVLWTANSALVIAMSWSSAYNQLLCGFFILLAFALYLKYEETGRRAFYWWQIAVFLLGFGALEINVAYPALLASYLIFTKRSWKPTIPLFACSLLFTIVHFIAAPKQTAGAYVLYFDRDIPATLGTYWKWVTAPETWWELAPQWQGVLVCGLFSAALIGFAIRQARLGRWMPLMFLSWFVLLLAPVLPLKHHTSAYYLTLPALGFASLGAAAFAESWRGGSIWRGAGVACVALYLAIHVPQSWQDVRWFYEVARSVKVVVLGVKRAHELHPAATILLANIGDDVFNHAITDGPFRLLDNCRVFLTPQSEREIANHPLLPGAADFVLPAGPTLKGLENEKILVYEPSGDHLRNITSAYERMARAEFKPDPPRRIDAGNPLFEYLLGPEWYAVEGNYRWMPRRATLHIGGPRAASEKLYLHAICPKELTRAEPLDLTISVDGAPPTRVRIKRSETELEGGFALPPEALGKKSLGLAIELSRALSARENGRELGLAFGTLAIR